MVSLECCGVAKEHSSELKAVHGQVLGSKGISGGPLGQPCITRVVGPCFMHLEIRCDNIFETSLIFIHIIQVILIKWLPQGDTGRSIACRMVWRMGIGFGFRQMGLESRLCFLLS